MTGIIPPIALPPKVQVTVNALTKTYAGKALQITSPVDVFNTVDPTKFAKTEAIWDTGATNSVITKALATKLDLIPIGKAVVKGVHGAKDVSVYPVRIILNNDKVSFTFPVTESDDLSADNSIDFLIGMDVISTGDFVISNFGGNTTMSFRTPSVQRTDYVQELQAHTPRFAGKVPGRNEKCPCGSGKKFKHCHGA